MIQLPFSKVKQLLPVLFFLFPHTVFAVFTSHFDFTVKEQAGIARQQGHVLASIPFARKEGIYDAGNLRVEGKEAEFTVLSRYDGAPDDTSRPIRTVLADFQDNFAAQQERQYQLTWQPVRFFTDKGKETALKENLAKEYPDYIEINTGIALFRISKKRGNLFDLVKVGDETVVQEPQNSGMNVIVDKIRYSSEFSKPNSCKIFRNGHFSAVIVVQGELKDAGKTTLKAQLPNMENSPVPDSAVEYAFYYTFFRDKSFVFVEQTLKNNGRGWSRYPNTPVEHLYLDSWQTNLEITSIPSARNVLAKDYKDKYSFATYILEQQEKNDHGFEVKGYDFSASLKRDGQKVKKWKRYDAYIAMENGGKGVMTAEKWFWQNYPNAWQLERNNLTSLFLPPRPANYSGFTPPAGISAPNLPDRYLDANQQYRMPGGMWKTHRTLYYFYNTDKPAFREAVAELQAPLQIQFSPSYWGRTNFFGTLFDAEFKTGYTFEQGERLDDAISRWRNYARSIWDPQANSRYGKSFSTLREERRTPIWEWRDEAGEKKYTYPSWYGWLRFGGSPRALNFGFNNQHYDFSWQAYLVSCREQYYPAFKLYEELVEHLADVLTLHDPSAGLSISQSDDILLHGAQRYEEDALGDNYTSRTLNINDPHYGNAHAWTKGVFLYYLLTGNPRYKEILDSYLFHVNASKSVGAAKGEIRDLSRLIGAALNYWDVFGDPAALDSAWEIWQRLEKNGVEIGEGMFAFDSRVTKEKIWIGYDSMTIPYVIRLYYAFKNLAYYDQASHLKNRLLQMGQWHEQKVLAAWPHRPGTYNSNGKYYKYTATNALYLNPEAKGDMSENLPYHWDNHHFNANYSLAWCDLYAFLYRETGDNKWLERARTAFKDRFMYNMANLNGQKEDPKKPFWQPYGIPLLPKSGSWKFGMATVIPLFYLQTEQLERY